MTIEEKTAHTIELSANKSDYDGLSEKLLGQPKCKGDKKLFTGKADHVGMDKIQTQDEYHLAWGGEILSRTKLL